MNRKKKINQILKSRMKKVKQNSNKPKYISKAEREKMALAEQEAAQTAEQSVEQAAEQPTQEPAVEAEKTEA
uniref:DUF2986 domain-containing protein n=1 Tax=Thaumasiovibrio occultus TaxID=1891184 RepID=UPI000B361D33|nr:DUF2986 domain-containing protein [Thaumasiovibrio occultus]